MNVDDKLIEAMQNEFAKYPKISKAVIFGSRVRGDDTPRSDYDIAVFGNIASKDQSALRYVFDEDLPTLHKIDLVFYCDINNEKFKNNIDKEGIIIYGETR